MLKVKDEPGLIGLPGQEFMNRVPQRPKPGPVACIIRADRPAPALVAAALVHEGFTVVERPFSRATRALIEDVEPDVVIAVIDPRVPEELGVLRFVRARIERRPLVAVCIGDGEDDADQGAALHAGADVALAASRSPAFIGAQASALTRHLLGRAPAGDQVTVAGDLTVDFGRRTVEVGGERIELTRSEFDILGALMHNAGRVLTPPAIVAAVGQFAESEAQAKAMVKVHISHLRQKLGPNAEDYVVTVRGVGYRFGGSR